jgi:hypothetical protein
VNSKIAAHLIGHLSADPRPFDLPRSGGAGCELRLTIARPDFDANGGRITRERRVKVVTYDTAKARHLAESYKLGDFVEILSDDVRTERAWRNNQNMWVSGGVVFTLTKIRKVTALTTDADTPAPAPAPGPDAAAADAEAEREPANA